MLNYYHQIIRLRTLSPFGTHAARGESAAQHSAPRRAVLGSLRDSGAGCCFPAFSLPQLSWKRLSLTGLLPERIELHLKGNFGANGNRSVRVVTKRFLEFPRRFRGRGKIKTFGTSLCSKGDGSNMGRIQHGTDPAPLPPAVCGAGGPRKSPQNGASPQKAPHMWVLSYFHLQKLKQSLSPHGTAEYPTKAPTEAVSQPLPSPTSGSSTLGTPIPRHTSPIASLGRPKVRAHRHRASNPQIWCEPCKALCPLHLHRTARGTA